MYLISCLSFEGEASARHDSPLLLVEALCYNKYKQRYKMAARYSSWLMTLPYDKPTILVVDDDPATADLLVELLNEEADCRASCVTSARRALEAVRNNPVDMLVLDVMMPEIGGAELYRILQETSSPRDIPVLFITAGRGGEQLASETGKLVLEKPFDLDTFLSAVRATLHGPARGYGPDLSGMATP
jgi:CheY-like chemotaxis protein